MPIKLMPTKTTSREKKEGKCTEFNLKFHKGKGNVCLLIMLQFNNRTVN